MQEILSETVLTEIYKLCQVLENYLLESQKFLQYQNLMAKAILKQFSQRTDMNPETVKNYTEEPETRQREIEGVDTTETKLLPPQTLSTETIELSAPTNAEWRKYGEKVGNFLQELPNYLGRFFKENQSSLTVVGLIFGALIAVKLTIAILDAINDIPLIAPTFELIGFGYAAWFIYRYLLRATNRRELVSDFKALKQQILGAKTKT